MFICRVMFFVLMCCVLWLMFVVVMLIGVLFFCVFCVCCCRFVWFFICSLICVSWGWFVCLWMLVLLVLLCLVRV